MKYKYAFCLISLLSLLSCNNGGASSKSSIEFDFIADHTFTSSNSLKFLLVPGVDFFLTQDTKQEIAINWGDGNKEKFAPTDLENEYLICSHNYDEDKTYNVSISGSIGCFSFASSIDDSTTPLSDGDINIDNVVINSMASIFMIDSDSYSSTLVLSTKTSDGKISKATNVKIKHNFVSLERVLLTDTSLETIDLPNSLIVINDSSFKDLKNLTSINLPSDSCLTIIEDNAFSGCSSLENFVVPRYVATMGEDVFKECSALKKVRFESIIPPEMSDTTFDVNNAPEVISVPVGSKTYYETELSVLTATEIIEE